MPNGGGSRITSALALIPTPANNLGRPPPNSLEPERESGGRNELDCDGSIVGIADLALGGNVEEQYDAMGQGLMMHMRFSISQ
jgi:hypothetical protein